MTYPPYPSGIAPNKSDPSAKGLQIALYHCRYWPTGVPFADNYGPTTQDSVRRFYEDHMQSWGPAIGPIGWGTLMKQAYASEPAQDMGRTLWTGRTVNKRTWRMLAEADPNIVLAQGSYTNAVAASAGTHSGGGVVDVSVSELNDVARNHMVLRLRMAGFAAWLRTPSEGFAYHIHACAIGDRQMAQSAKDQVRAFFLGRDGLADNGPDTFIARPVPAWTYYYK